MFKPNTIVVKSHRYVEGFRNKVMILAVDKFHILQR